MSPRKIKKTKSRGVKSETGFQKLNLMGAVYTVNLSCVREFLPPGSNPLVIFPGTALAGIFCLEIHKSDLGAYCEVAIGILLETPGTILPGPLDVLSSLASGISDVFLCQLPVTTEKARSGGVSVFNLPKFVADISFRETSSHRICTVMDKKSLELILEFDLEKTATGTAWTKCQKQHVVRMSTANSVKHRAVMTFDLMDWGLAVLLPSSALRWGRDAKAETLKNLKWGIPILEIYAPQAKAVLRAEDI